MVAQISLLRIIVPDSVFHDEELMPSLGLGGNLVSVFIYMFKQSCRRVRVLTKTLTIRDEIYDKLAAVKGKNESFSELFDRLVDGAGSLESLKKLRGSAEFADKKKMLREVEASRAERRI